MLKILLVNAPAPVLTSEPIVVPPLGLAYLAAAVRERGHDVTILDAFAERLDWDAFAERVGQDTYDVIGFTATTHVFDSVQRAISICRPHGRITILGGPHATSFPEAVLPENPELDFAVYGEGEQTFVEFLNVVDEGGDFDTIPGLITRKRVGAPRPMVGDLDSVPYPARDLLPNSRYRYPSGGAKRVTTIITSRGCPYPCVFCDKGVFGPKWRARSAENVLGEIDDVVSTYGVGYIVIYDDLFTLHKKRLKAICEGLIERRYPLRWKAEGRVNLVDPDSLRLMRRAGCDTIAYGVESANQVGLNFLKKRIKPDMAREAFRLTRQAGIKTVAYFILGIPVESYEDAQRTIRFANEIKADYAQFSILSPLPGTELYDEAMKKGWYRKITARGGGYMGLVRPAVVTDEWTEEKLNAIVKEAHRRFYLRPAYIISRLRQLRNVREMVNLLGMGWSMLKYVLTGRFVADRRQELRETEQANPH